MGKFWVFKSDDIDKYLSNGQYVQLVNISGTIGNERIKEGKNPDNKYMIINRDEPYAEEVLEIMKKHGHWEDK